MRNFLLLLAALAFLAATALPSASYAVAHAGAKNIVMQADCHGDMEKSGECCEKGACKCVSNACHGNLARDADNKDFFFPAYQQARCAFSDEVIASVLPEGLRRPPRA